MYQIVGLGKRIATYRKRAGLTQEELAEKLNITGQAVSKWENEISFPDVTILPEIALVLNTTMEKLFGNDQPQGTRPDPFSVFPQSRGKNMRLTHVYEGTACYSEKEIKTIESEKVLFKDGSCADLRLLTIVNKGTGEILFDYNEKLQLSLVDDTVTQLNEVYDHIHSIDLTLNSADFTVAQSADHKTYVNATGTPYFIAGLKVEKKDQSLIIKHAQTGQDHGNSHGMNKLTILLGIETGRVIKGTFNGSGDIHVDVPFEHGNLAINGSGSIRTKDMGAFEGKINGSGDISCGKIGSAKVTINGSGDFDCIMCSESLAASINGSGDMTIKAGILKTIEIAIRGSGDVDASGVTTDKADISISGSGDVVVGRVKVESVEKHSKNSSIKVLQRG
ncbi:MAG TPA: hypothetical protein DDZ89_03765 [Clostridiales bacterium]|nr:hypothetical protein [Clostridiales bacterium]